MHEGDHREESHAAQRILTEGGSIVVSCLSCQVLDIIQHTKNDKTHQQLASDEEQLHRRARKELAHLFRGGSQIVKSGEG